MYFHPAHKSLEFPKGTLRQNAITPIKHTGIFNFTEVLNSNEGEPKLSSRKVTSQRLSPLDSLEKAMKKDTHESHEKISKFPRSNSLFEYGFENPKLINRSSTQSLNNIFDNSDSTMNTLQTIPSDPFLMSSEKKVACILPELFEEDAEEPPVIEEELPKPKPKKVNKRINTKVVRSSIEEILQQCKVLQREVARIDIKAKKTEASYEECIEKLDESLKDESMKFEFWKKDKPFLRLRAEIKDQINRFCAPVVQTRKQREKERELDHYLPTQFWENESDKENENFNNIERLILQEARPFRIKKILSRREQFDLRPKPSSSIFQETGIGLNIEEYYADKPEPQEKKRRPILKNKEQRGSINSVKSRKTHEVTFITEPLHNTSVHELNSNISVTSSTEASPKEICSNKVYYFASIKKVHGYKGGLKKDLVKRQCTPTAAEPKERPYNFKESFAMFKKSSLAKRGGEKTPSKPLR